MVSLYYVLSFWSLAGFSWTACVSDFRFEFLLVSNFYTGVDFLHSLGVSKIFRSCFVLFVVFVDVRGSEACYVYFIE